MRPESVPRIGRRDFLRRGAIASVVTGAGLAAGRSLMSTAGAAGGAGLPSAALFPPSNAVDYPSIASVRLMTTDGHLSFPGRRHSTKPVYAFGFRAIDDSRLVADGGELNANPGDLMEKYRGHVMHTSPTIIAMEGVEMAIVVTNLGFKFRPDLADSHTLHWHGFRNATAIFDGVPELSAAVPPGRDLPYFFDPKLPGSVGQPKGSAGGYMYHCHFEDVEHVQMGMSGVVFIEPRDMWYFPDGTARAVRNKVAYNPTAAGIDTSFDREFALLANEIDYRPHDNLETLQLFTWSDYAPQYRTFNGRAYPDTVVPQITPAEQVASYQEPLQMPAVPTTPDEVAEAEMLWQQNSSLVQAREGDRVLIRLSNLGYEIHSIELIGVNDMRVIANDASLLVGKDGTNDLTYLSRRMEIGPGESREAIFTAPAYVEANAEIDPLATRLGKQRKFCRYLIKSRNVHRLNNNGQVYPDGPSYAGAKGTYGGMVTELWVYPTLADAPGLSQDGLPDQITVNETFPTLVVPAGQV